MSAFFRRASLRTLTLVGAPVVLGVALSVPAPAAQAAAPASTSVSTTSATPTSAASAAAAAQHAAHVRAVHRAKAKAARQRAFGAKVVHIAASRRGSPYHYGASGPHSFDCSGLTKWAFGKMHRGLPHSSAAQYGRTKHIRASDRRPGDLVFFHDGGGIYHVAIYAGHDKIWHAPYPGTSVRLERMWTHSVYYGRVR